MKTARLIFKYNNGEFGKFGEDLFKGDKEEVIEITDAIFNSYEELEEKAEERMGEFKDALDSLPENSSIMQNLHIFDSVSEENITEDEEELDTIVDGYFRNKSKEIFGSDNVVVEYLISEKVKEDIVVVFIDFSRDKPYKSGDFKKIFM